MRSNASIPTECNVPGFKEQDLVRHLSVDDFQAYLKSRLEILEADLMAKLEEEIARLNKPLDERERRVLLARKHIEEEFMQLKCPGKAVGRSSMTLKAPLPSVAVRVPKF